MQLRTIPMLAHAYAFVIAARWMRVLHTKLMSQLEKGNTALLPVVHAYSSGIDY